MWAVVQDTVADLIPYLVPWLAPDLVPHHKRDMVLDPYRPIDRERLKANLSGGSTAPGKNVNSCLARPSHYAWRWLYGLN
jgi:hypothetical protein